MLSGLRNFASVPFSIYIDFSCSIYKKNTPFSSSHIVRGLVQFFPMLMQVSNSGWAEGECKGKAGWFPLDYVERRERVLASKMTHVF